MPAGGSPTPGGAAFPEVRRDQRRSGLASSLQEGARNVLANLFSASGPLSFRLWIDFGNDGLLSGDDTVDSLFPYTIDTGPDGTIDGSALVVSLEDVSDRVRLAQPIALSVGRDQAREYAPPVAGKMEFLLDNPDGVLSSANTASPLFGRLNPGLLCVLEASTGGTWYRLHTGYTDLPAERPGARQQAVSVASLDGLAKLRAATISTAMYTNVRVDQAIGYCLDAAGWPASLRRLQVADTTLTRWWVDGVDAFSAVRDLQLTEGPGSILYVDPADGCVVFENRHYRLLTPRCTQSQVTVRSQGDEPVFGPAFDYDPGVAGIVNTCTVAVKSFAVGGLGVLWSGPAAESLGGGEARPYFVNTTADGFTGALDPVAATDYAVTGGSVVSATLSRSSGKTAVLTVTAGPTGASFTGLQVRGQTVTASTRSYANTVSGASASGVDYGVKTFPDELLPTWLPDENTARDFCNYVVSRYKDPVPRLRFTLNTFDNVRTYHMLVRKLSDRVRVVESLRAKIDADFFVEQLARSVPSGDMITAFYCEAASGFLYWVLGDATLGVLGTSTKLGY